MQGRDEEEAIGIGEQFLKRAEYGTAHSPAVEGWVIGAVRHQWVEHRVAPPSARNVLPRAFIWKSVY
jgi:hypothetical protein